MSYRPQLACPGPDCSFSCTVGFLVPDRRLQHHCFACRYMATARFDAKMDSSWSEFNDTGVPEHPASSIVPSPIALMVLWALGVESQCPCPMGIIFKANQNWAHVFLDVLCRHKGAVEAELSACSLVLRPMLVTDASSCNTHLDSSLW